MFVRLPYWQQWVYVDGMVDELEAIEDARNAPEGWQPNDGQTIPDEDFDWGAMGANVQRVDFGQNG